MSRLVHSGRHREDGPPRAWLRLRLLEGTR
jgi:hypothetical protein